MPRRAAKTRRALVEGHWLTPSRRKLLSGGHALHHAPNARRGREAPELRPWTWLLRRRSRTRARLEVVALRPANDRLLQAHIQYGIPQYTPETRCLNSTLPRFRGLTDNRRLAARAKP